MTHNQIENAKSGIETDVLIFLESRFDSILKIQKDNKEEQKEVNERIFSTLSEVKCLVNKALNKQEVNEAVDKIKNSKANKIGEFFITMGVSAATAAAIIAFFNMLTLKP